MANYSSNGPSSSAAPRKDPNRTSRLETPATRVTGSLYLIAYNSCSAIAWASVLYRALYAVAVQGYSHLELYSVVGDRLRIVQSVAVLEILHVLLALVKSPLFTTSMQVFSRLLIVWVTLYCATDSTVQQHWAFSGLLVAWGITEIIRYAYYMFSQLAHTPYMLTWLRYNSFIPLYPLGVFSECTLIYTSLPAAHRYHPLLKWILVAVLTTYPPGLYTLYTYMLRQRRKVLSIKPKIV